MQQTLFTIPHAWFDGPLLIGWLILSGLILLFLLIRHGWTQDTWSFLPVIAVGVVVVWLVLPQVEIDGINPANPTGPMVKQGLAVRGYGVCLLLAIVCGVGITLQRCRAAGIDPERILSLALWMTIAGIAGARLLYVVQKSDEFFGSGLSLRQSIVQALDMTKGGLVVYGSLIGGLIAALIFFRVTRLSFAKTADLIAPGMVLGLAIGRIGCLMNGCCYGGLCEAPLPAVRFPAGAPAYMQQISHGELLGVRTEVATADPFDRKITAIERDGIGDQLDLEVGDRVTIYAPDPMYIQFFKQHAPVSNDGRELAVLIDSKQKGQLTVPLSQLSMRSLNVHPTQIYSAVNAGLLSLLLWLFWTVRRFDGQVFALMLILYSISRFLLEIVRCDESGLMGTPLTISQWVSSITIVVGLGLWGWLDGRSRTRPVAS